MAIEKAADFFDQIKNRMDTDADTKASLGELGATYQFNINGDGGGSYTLNLSDGTVSEGEDDDADCTIAMESEDFMGMVNGELQGQQLFMMGKLMITGDMTLALQLEQVFSAAAE